jgi:hypothetical protein
MSRPLTVDPEAIAKCPFYVLDEGGTITGFYGLSGQPPRGEIEFLFVAAVGRRLLLGRAQAILAAPNRSEKPGPGAGAARSGRDH